MEKVRERRWIIIFIMCLGTMAAYAVPLMLKTYYPVMKEAVGLTDTQLGYLMTSYTVASMVFYLPGGWIGDRINPKYLITISFVLCGLLSMIMLTKPTFLVLLVMQFLFAACTSLLVWAAIIKCIRSLGDAKIQGSLYAAREWMSGIAGMIMGFGAQYIASWYPESQSAIFTSLIVTYTVISITCGLGVFFLLGKNYDPNLGEPEVIDLKAYGKVLRTKEVWLVALSIFFIYHTYDAIAYTNGYMQKAFGMASEDVTILATIRSYGIRAITPFIAGLVIDKIGSAARVLQFCIIGTIASLLVYAYIPQQADMLVIAIAVLVIYISIITASRSTYYAQLSEVKLPIAYTGMATGIISIIAYFPDAYFFVVGGHMIETYGLQGYNYIFIACALLGLVSLMLSCVLIRIIKKKNAELANN